MLRRSPSSETPAREVRRAARRARPSGTATCGAARQAAPAVELLSPVPTVAEFELGAAEGEFLILACDGVWDVLSDQQAVDIVGRHPDAPDRACEALIHAAQAGGSGDNVTALLLAMTPSSPVMRRPPARFPSS